MFYQKTIAVIIPAYRVEPFIARVIRGIPRYVDWIVVVDDCSPDQTSSQAEAAADPRVILLRHPENRGVGGAMKTGFRKARELGADIVVKMDGDGQMDPAYLPALLYPLAQDECDYTKGNRFGIGAPNERMPLGRWLGNQLLSFATKAVSGYWHVFDPQNGYSALTGARLQQLPLDRIDDSYFYENSMLVNLNILEARVADVCIPAIYGSETSSLRIGWSLRKFPAKLLAGLFRRLFYRYVYQDLSPVFLMLAAGSLLLSGGLAWGGWGWYQSVATGRVMTTGTIVLGLIPVMTGFQLILDSVLMDIRHSPGGRRKRYCFSSAEIKRILEQGTAAR